MKKTTIQFSFDEEKLAATNLYMSQKDATLDLELTECFEKLYAKFVPTNVREYIELRNAMHGTAQELSKKKSSL